MSARPLPSRPGPLWRAAILWILVQALVACGADPTGGPVPDSGAEGFDAGADPVPLDAGFLSSADATIPDSGAPFDGGAPFDSGAAFDSGLANDSGPAVDSGSPADSGVVVDAGPNDAGAPVDAGGAADSGSPGDSGTAADGGSASDGGAGTACDPIAQDCGPGLGCYLVQLLPLPEIWTCATAGNAVTGSSCANQADCGPGNVCLNGPGYGCLQVCRYPNGACRLGLPCQPLSPSGTSGYCRAEP